MKPYPGLRTGKEEGEKLDLLPTGVAHPHAGAGLYWLVPACQDRLLNKYFRSFRELVVKHSHQENFNYVNLQLHKLY